jgi:topoisomerase IA-like protein
LALPRTLGQHPDTGIDIFANVAASAHTSRTLQSLRPTSVRLKRQMYDITFERALEILKEEKKRRGFAKRKKKHKSIYWQ